MGFTSCHRVLDAYVHSGRIGVLAEFGCHSDFLEKMQAFRSLIRDVVVHIVAKDPATTEQLLEQLFVKDESKTVGELLDEMSRHFGERIVVLRFVRWTTECKELPFEEGPPPTPAVILNIGNG